MYIFVSGKSLSSLKKSLILFYTILVSFGQQDGPGAFVRVHVPALPARGQNLRSGFDRLGQGSRVRGAAVAKGDPFGGLLESWVDVGEFVVRGSIDVFSRRVGYFFGSNLEPSPNQKQFWLEPSRPWLENARSGFR